MRTTVRHAVSRNDLYQKVDFPVPGFTFTIRALRAFTRIAGMAS